MVDFGNWINRINSCTSSMFMSLSDFQQDDFSCMAKLKPIENATIIITNRYRGSKDNIPIIAQKKLHASLKHKVGKEGNEGFYVWDQSKTAWLFLKLPLLTQLFIKGWFFAQFIVNCFWTYLIELINHFEVRDSERVCGWCKQIYYSSSKTMIKINQTQHQLYGRSFNLSFCIHNDFELTLWFCYMVFEKSLYLTKCKQG